MLQATWSFQPQFKQNFLVIDTPVNMHKQIERLIKCVNVSDGNRKLLRNFRHNYPVNLPEI